MAGLQDKNLERSVDGAINQFNKAAHSLRTWQQVIDDVGKAMAKNNPAQEFEDVIKAIDASSVASNKQRIAAVRAGIDELKQAHRLEQEMSLKHTTERARVERRLADIDLESLRSKKQALITERTTLRKIDTEKREAIKRQLDSIEAEIQNADKLRQYQASMSAEHTASLKRVTDRIGDLTSGIQTETATIRNNTTVRAKASSALVEYITNTAHATGTVSNFAAELKLAYYEFRRTFTAQRGFTEGSSQINGYLKTVYQSLRSGVSPADIAEISSNNRQAMLAYGGVNKSLSMFRETLSDGTTLEQQYFAMTGNLKDAAAVAASQMTILTQSGIKPTTVNMSRMATDMKDISKRTGLSITEISSRMSDFYAKDEDMQSILKAARIGERDSIIASTNALIKNNVALGMSAEQALSAAKMLNKMVSQKPIDRIKQAAKMRAMAGAMGVSGGAEAAQAMIAGKRATGEQKAALDDFNKRMATAVEQSSQKGLGYEIMASSMLEKTGLDAQYGPNSPFSTSLLAAAKPTEQAVNNLTDVVKDPLTNMARGFDKMLNALTVLGVVTTGIAVMIGTGAARKALSGAAERFTGGKGPRGPTGTPDGRTAAKFGAKSVAKKIAGIGLIAGLALGAERALAGDMVGAGLEVASGAAGGLLPPGLGTAASIGIDAAIMARDANKAAAPTTTADAITKAAENPTASLFGPQMAKLDQSNVVLKQIYDTNEKQLETLQKLLEASLMTDKQKEQESMISAIDRLNRVKDMAPTYNYLG